MGRGSDWRANAKNDRRECYKCSLRVNFMPFSVTVLPLANIWAFDPTWEYTLPTALAWVISKEYIKIEILK